MDAARRFTGGVEARNHLAVDVKHLCVGVDLQAAHRVVDGRDLLAGVPGAFGHDLVGLVVGDEAERILLFTAYDGVVGVDRTLEVFDRHLELGGKLLERVGCDDAAEIDHVAHLGAVAVNPREARIAQMVDEHVVGRVLLCEDGLGEDVAGCAFIDEAVAVRVDEDAVAARRADHFHEARARRAAGMNLNVGHADHVRADFLAHQDAGALGGLLEVRAADALAEVVVFEDARVDFLTELHVGAEAAGCNDHALFSLEERVAAGLVVLGKHARHAAVGVLEHVFGFNVGDDLHVGMLGDVLLEDADVGVARRSGGIVGALPERARGRADLVLELHADRFEPFDGGIGAFTEVFDELGVAHVVAALERLVDVFRNGVLNAELGLADRVGRIERAFGDVRRAAEKAELFEHDHVGARLGGGDRSGKAGTAAADDDDLRLHRVGERLVLFNILLQVLEVLGGNLGLLEAFAHGVLERHRADRGARDAVNAETLLFENPAAHLFKGELADADRLKVLRPVDLLDFVLRNRDGDRHGGIVRVHFVGVGAGHVGGGGSGHRGDGKCGGRGDRGEFHGGSPLELRALPEAVVNGRQKKVGAQAGKAALERGDLAQCVMMISIKAPARS